MTEGRDRSHSGANQDLLINPFIGKNPNEMSDMTNKFLEDTKIDEDHHEYIRKGAFLAQAPDAFHEKNPAGLKLKPFEEQALEQEDPEKGSRWDQPVLLYALIGCCSMGAAVQGWDETAVNQAQIYYSTDLGIDSNKADLLRNPDILLGLVK
ncbi:MAG: Solute carrier 2 (Facilitated glucose transporter) member 8 [Alyxoria varia]|nr:MAG: Solute carrier 2 (Facilitated glucose transporter) member 8 [Alyxoria varia]